VTGFVGTAVWAAPGWRLANAVGWLLLIGGFLLQYLHVRRTPGSTPLPREVEALLTVLERNGVLRKAEALEEIARLRETAVKARSTHHERRGDPRRSGGNYVALAVLAPRSRWRVLDP
jgi:hypothetical protein